MNIAGNGEVTLAGTNTYSGGTTVGVPSTLNIFSSTAIGTGRLTMAGGNLDNSSGGPVVLGNVPQTWNSGFQYNGSSLLNLGTGPVTVSSTSSVTPGKCRAVPARWKSTATSPATPPLL